MVNYLNFLAKASQHIEIHVFWIPKKFKIFIFSLNYNFEGKTSEWPFFKNPLMHPSYHFRDFRCQFWLENKNFEKFRNSAYLCVIHGNLIPGMLKLYSVPETGLNITWDRPGCSFVQSPLVFGWMNHEMVERIIFR